MKNVLFLLTFTVALAFLAVDSKAQNFGLMVNDTLTTSAALDTLTGYVGGATVLDARELRKGGAPRVMEYAFKFDSISGATNGTFYLEYSNSISRPTETDQSWYSPSGLTSSFLYMNGTTPVLTIGTANTFTINGTLSKISVKDTNFSANWVRGRYLTTSATQSTRMQGWAGGSK